MLTHQALTCGADGLVKLWNVRSAECVATFDEHSDKIWALAVGGDADNLLVTGLQHNACCCRFASV